MIKHLARLNSYSKLSFKKLQKVFVSIFYGSVILSVYLEDYLMFKKVFFDNESV